MFISDTYILFNVADFAPEHEVIENIPAAAINAKNVCLNFRHFFS